MELKDKAKLAISQKLVTRCSGLGNCRLSKCSDDISATRPDANALLGAPCEWMLDSHSTDDLSITGGNLKP